MPEFLAPLKKLRDISRFRNSYRRQLWVVSYVNQEGGSPLTDQAFADIESSFAGGKEGADALILINEWSTLAELESTLEAVRARYPELPLGCNYLGDDQDPYGVKDSFRLAKDYQLQIVWTDFSGVDLIHEKRPVNLHDIQALRPPQVFYGSGIHMKYSTLLDPQKTIEESALQAMGWVDGIIVTGAKTGIPCNPEIARRARQVIGDYPLGVASGVSAENVDSLRQFVDFYLVASSLQDAKKRILSTRVQALRRSLGCETWPV